jgi:hypothetical protein
LSRCPWIAGQHMDHPVDLGDTVEVDAGAAQCLDETREFPGPVFSQSDA